MGAAVKLVAGIIILLVGLFLWVDSIWLHYTRVAWWDHFLNIVKGIIPAILILIGLFMVWLQMDEIKADKELKKEPKPSK